MAFINIGFFSETLGVETSCHVILPQPKHLEEAAGKRYPVLWLLHGAYGSYHDWTRYTSIERYVRTLGLCVVMPSAQNSGYLNMAHGGRYYSYIAEELPKKMREFFPLSDKREDNFIAGLSMGGEGAMMFGLSKPENYSVIGCLSAGMPEETLRIHAPFLSAELDGMSYEKTYRDAKYNAQRIVNEGLPCPHIYHTCGNEDFLLDRAHRTREFFESFQGNPFDYCYEEDAGTHSWEYWDEHIQHFLRYLNLKPDIEYS